MGETGTESDNRGHDAPDPCGPGALLPAQEKALAALLTSGTVEGAARKAGVSDRTLHRWLADPAFKAAYLSARRALLDQTTGLLQRASAGAVAALIRNLSCGQPGAEIRAAQVILDLSYKGLELADIEARVSELEAELGDKG